MISYKLQIPNLFTLHTNIFTSQSAIHEKSNLGKHIQGAGNGVMSEFEFGLSDVHAVAPSFETRP